VPVAGESVALQRLEKFAQSRLESYVIRRDMLDINPFTDDDAGTSGLSPYFRLGMISPRQAYSRAVEARKEAKESAARHSIDVWISELAWRDFYSHTLYHFPHTYNISFREEYERFPWRKVQDELQAWMEARTGYPIVDAAMRQLDAIGWMHNRARMIVAAFLTKDLLIYWREGNLHFMRTLIDGDPAANTGGWQWSAGTGKDSQPFFRIFNPVTQSRKFDPQGRYIRHWLPELRDVPDKYIHTPWLMVTPPRGYPPPVVEHDFARDRALAAFRARKVGDGSA
jgi:deoxyribodipyrimidine photo-lyase